MMRGKKTVSMHSAKTTVSKPLTKSMQATLAKVYEHKKLQIQPLEAGTARSSKGLALRGMVEVQPWCDHKGKKIMALFITRRGMDYIDAGSLKGKSE